MPTTASTVKPKLRIALFLGALLALLSPIAIYWATFGITIATEHNRWAEFGSAMSGIYSPLIAFLTLSVLGLQVLIQRAQSKHESDQAHILQARADIEFYLLRLDEYLSTVWLRGNTVRDSLHEVFQPATASDLDSEKLRGAAKELDRGAPRVLAVWFAIYPILKGLHAANEQAYELCRTSSVSKIIVMLSFETCVALDNFHRARTEGRVAVPYEFSPLLSPRSGA